MQTDTQAADPLADDSHDASVHTGHESNGAATGHGFPLEGGQHGVQGASGHPQVCSSVDMLRFRICHVSGSIVSLCA